MTSHPTNPDHNTVSYNLLSEVFRARKQPEQEAACLSAVILNHPLLPHLWARMGRVYFELSKIEISQNVMSSDSLATSEKQLLNEGSSQKSENQISNISKVFSEDELSVCGMSNGDELSVVQPRLKDSLRLRHLAAACLVRSLLLLKSVQKLKIKPQATCRCQILILSW